ncbi:MAG: DUF5666 domain-containing protein [Ignavibacteriales bacterium]
MKRKLFLLILCCLFIFSFSLVSFASNNKSDKRVKARVEMQEENVQPQSVCQSVYQSVYAREGFIRSISATEIVVGKKNMADETLKINTQTVFKNVKAKQKTAVLAELKVGMKVLVKFDENRNATLIKILPQKTEKISKDTKGKKALKHEKAKVKNHAKKSGKKNK